MRSSEGTEDIREDGADVVRAMAVGPADLVLAVTASGRTPWCLGALEEARSRGVFTAAITCNLQTLVHEAADVTIDPVVGPEVLSGSTRMKAGTAQKLVLNMISTGIMVRTGRTYGHLMVGLTATSEKLRARARRLVFQVTGETKGVDSMLAAADWDVRLACLMRLRKLSAEQGRTLLDTHGGSLRAALGEDH